MALLTEADCRRIEEGIARIEKRSAAEFVVAVLPRSANYSKWRALIAGTWAIAAAIAYFQFVPWGGEVWGLLLELPVGAVVWAVLGYPSIRRHLMPAHEAERAVHGAAFRLFAERGVHRTRDRTGMLLYISELERRAVLLGDSGIHERVGDEGWPRHIAHLVSRIREGRTTDGVLEVLEALETSLAAKLPVGAGDVDELSNRVIQEP
jgi:putative membrane protein